MRPQNKKPKTRSLERNKARAPRANPSNSSLVVVVVVCPFFVFVCGEEEACQENKQKASVSVWLHTHHHAGVCKASHCQYSDAFFSVTGNKRGALFSRVRGTTIFTIENKI